MGWIAPHRNRWWLVRLADMPRYGPRKYDPLVAYLAGLFVDEVTLTFSEIERIVDAPLPPSAYRPSFWSTSPRSLVMRPWRRAGWRVVRTELSARPPLVTFARVAADSTTERLGPPRR
jgi:hypothetical protein